MPSRLQQTLTFTDVAPGGTATVAHTLNINGVAVVPDEIVFDNPALDFVSATTSAVTITNAGEATVTGSCRLTKFHSFVRPAGRGFNDPPFVIRGGGGAGAGGGGSATITLVPTVAAGDEDEVLAGNVLAGATTTVGTLSVMQYTIAGQVGVYQAGETATIPSRGTFSLLADGTYELIPFANYNGAIPVITYQVTNTSDIRISTVTLSIGAVNDPPVANDDARITLVNTPITIDVLANDSDPDDDALTVTHLNGVAVVLNAPVDIGDAIVTYLGDGDFEVAPDLDFEGSVSFTYTITDGAASDTATVTVLVGAANQPMFSSAAPIASALDNAAFNFGLTFRGLIGAEYNNGVNVAIPPYSANQGLFDLNNREPWLYDRATCCYVLYLRTQDPEILADAIELADLYMAGVQVSGNNLGTFNITGGDNGANPADIKYLYPIIGVWYEHETASSVHRTKSIALYNQALQSFSKTYNPNSAALWTERNAGYAIQACVSAYWLHWNAGNAAAAATALADAWDYFDMVEGMSVASGAPLHGHNQHEGSAITTPITSPWMSSFLLESMMQLYRTDPDVRIQTWMTNYGDFLLDNAFYVTNEGDIPGIQGLRLPAYLVANTQTPETYREGELLDMEHAHDVAGVIKKVIWAKTLLAESTAAFTTLLGELETVAVEVFAYWTRNTEGYPRYRVMPPRKYGWWFRNGYSDTSLFYTEQVPSEPLLVGGVTISGSTQAGSLLTAAPGTWAGTPAPTLTYQWYREGVAIGGATNSTYTTQVADEGNTITVRETATNTAGTNFDDSNGIDVVPAGAPEITAHPANDTASAGETAQFSATCDASPAATYQWQVNDGGGWANVVGGTGGSGSGNTTTYTTPVLAAEDNGNLYRCVFTNVSGSATTNSAALSMTVDQGAASFSANTSGAALTYSLGNVGHSDFVIEALMYFEGELGNSIYMGLRHSGNGRAVYIQNNNVFEQYDLAVGDTQTGLATFATPPPLNTWLHVTLQGTTLAGGDTLRATWTVAEGAAGTRYAVTKANGIEDSVQGEVVFIGGNGISGQAAQPACRYQYVRGRTGNLADEVVDGHRQDVDPTGWAFWWRFYDAGGGTLGVEDKTGNNRVPTITGGAFATGPVVPGVP